MQFKKCIFLEPHQAYFFKERPTPPPRGRAPGGAETGEDNFQF